MTDHTPDRKRRLRQEIRERVSTFAPQIPAWSAQLRALLGGADFFQRARALMAFIPLPPPAAEPDLLPLLGEALAGGRAVCLPRVDWEAGVMEPAAITSLESLVTTRHGLREPPPLSNPVALEDLDLILVPGLAFDACGNRLGRGAGFYDRFLAACVPDTTVCGVCFEAQLVDRIPTDDWDLPVNIVATERRLIRLQP